MLAAIIHLNWQKVPVQMAVNIHRQAVIMYRQFHRHSLRPVHRMIHSNELKINVKVLQHHLPISFDDHRVATVAVAVAEVMAFLCGFR